MPTGVMRANGIRDAPSSLPEKHRREREKSVGDFLLKSYEMWMDVMKRGRMAMG